MMSSRVNLPLAVVVNDRGNDAGTLGFLAGLGGLFSLGLFIGLFGLGVGLFVGLFGLGGLARLDSF